MAAESQEALASLGWQEKGAAAPDGAAPNGAAAPPPSAPPAVPSGGSKPRNLLHMETMEG